MIRALQWYFKRHKGFIPTKDAQGEVSNLALYCQLWRFCRDLWR
jgi:hypothetical protein